MKTIDLKEFRDGSDWQYAFHEARYGCCGPEDLSCVAEVIAADPGDNDGPEWIAVVRLDGTGWSEGLPQFCVMRAGCDYTGWDCQAGGKVEFYETREEALSPLTLTAEELARLGMVPVNSR